MGDKISGDPSVFQDSFESIVQQSMDDFEMEREEAIADALQQLKTQGVNTRFIVTDERAHDVPAQIAELAALAADDAGGGGGGQLPRLADLLLQLRLFCAAGLAERCLAGRRGAYAAVLACLDSRPADALDTLAALQDGQPDLFRPADAGLLLAQLERQPTEALAWAAAVTLQHERNRQALADAGLLPLLAGRLRQHEQTERHLLPAVCTLVCQMTRDDDVRVPYGRAHEHARQLAEEHGVLDALVELLKDSAEEPALSVELIQTCTKLCVRHEFCEQVAISGGIDVLTAMMRRNPRHTAAIGRSFFFIRTLAGSDKVKATIMKTGLADIIAASLSELKTKGMVCEAAFAAIGALTLRSSENAERLAAAGVMPAMIDAMELHPAADKTQKLACMAVRNMVSHSPELKPAFRELGVEKLINDALRTHGKMVYDEGRAALRDLECQVLLKEEWTGRGGALTTGLIVEPERVDQ